MGTWHVSLAAPNGVVQLVTPAEKGFFEKGFFVKGFCEKCFTRILVSVSTRQLQTRADCTMLCMACFEKIDPGEIAAYTLAGTVEAIRREMNTAGPNPFRRANN